ncbi:hypothetical protein ACWIID_42855 [Streptomyces phaeochromogenes]
MTEYLTPLDGFTEGRAAVLAAAQDLSVPTAGQKVLQRAFTAHGIVPGWELALGVDSDPLLGRVNTTRTNLGAAAAGGRRPSPMRRARSRTRSGPDAPTARGNSS